MLRLGIHSTLGCLLLWRTGSVHHEEGGAEERESILRDISYDVCWSGPYTKESCCKGDATTNPDCWDSAYTFNECCPNADCWDSDAYTYQMCCSPDLGPNGNPACWAGSSFSYESCCLAETPGQSWVDVMVAGAATEQFYSMDEFFTDAQYGDDFGYYSTGRVLRNSKLSEANDHDTQQFAHFTTYPMAMSPHFARVFCRLLFVMWIKLEERTPFRVVEMGAGSGQLSFDIQKCVKKNELGIAPSVWRRWVAAFEYLIMERSPALAKRQRERGLRVVAGDAQTKSSCKPVLAALAASDACTGATASASAECIAGDRGTTEAGASVVISNELLDAFAPIKLRFSLYGAMNVTSCSSWQEVRLVHVIAEDDLRSVLRGRSGERAEGLIENLRRYTDDVFCYMANTTIGKEATNVVPAGVSCLALVFALGDLVNHLDLRIPAAAHNMRLRLRKDRTVADRLRKVVRELHDRLGDAVAIPRNLYRKLRHELRTQPDIEVELLKAMDTKHIPVTLTAERCDDLTWWFQAHEQRIARLATLYRELGYPAVHIVVRPGERDFIELVDCLIGPAGGFKLSLDYGASFEPLAHSLTVDPLNDGVFVPPIPQELMLDLPECHNFWPKCAGRIDWTTFVDFTNLAVAGEKLLGWRTVAYGPQNILEHMSRQNVTFTAGSDAESRRSYSVPGYSVAKKSPASRHVASWYGHEGLGAEAQGWTSFKALLLEKPASVAKPKHTIDPVDQDSHVIAFPSWHLDTHEVDSCWELDPTMVPLADWILRQSGPGRSATDTLRTLTEEINVELGRNYSIAYEEAQLAVRIVDWFVTTQGCPHLDVSHIKSILGSPGLWASLRGRLVRSWGELWGEETVARLSRSLLERLADRSTWGTPAAPGICAGVQTYLALCEAPGGGDRMW